MAADRDAYIDAHLDRSRAALTQAAANSDFRDALKTIATAIRECFDRGGKLLIVGNGGSAADAQHLAAEFLSRYTTNRRPLPAVALTTDTSALTAIGNDFGFDHVFERQVRALGQSHDLLLAISTSGSSRNVLAALQAARDAGMMTIGFTGRSAPDMQRLCDVCLMIPSGETAIIQQIHIIAGHIVCGLVERSIAAKGLAE